MQENVLGETPKQTPEVAPTGPGGNSFAEDLANCLKYVTPVYGFNGLTKTQCEASKPLLEDFLNEYFTVEDGHLKIQNGLVGQGVNVLGDGKLYFEMTPHVLSMYGNAEGINLRRGFYIFYDYDNFKSPVYRVYEAQRSISEDPNYEHKPKKEQGNILGPLIGMIEYREDRKKKFKRS